MAIVLRSVPAARGPRWVGDAFRLFVRRPIGFTFMFALFLVAALMLAQLPWIGGLLQMMLLPLLSLGFMIAGQSVLLGGPALPQHFIEALRTDARRRRAIGLLCLSYGLAALAILMLSDAVSDHAWERLQPLLAQGDAARDQVADLLSEPGVAWGSLLAAVLGSLLSVPYWHAPALVHWGGQGARQALFSSTLALWRNKGAYAMYMLAWTSTMLSFALVSALLFGLFGAQQSTGALGIPAGIVLSSVFYLSVLFTFNDCFGGALPSAEPLPPPAA
ncbi:MAG: hypothetical protein KGL18_16345 [Burkholderiales bacterium]|nr:hypothetical protein [Burkholderiales bacterium]MDE2159186.1 hypothetical protein [Burkholderiales bacterium]MDE2504536.1 hypothetical protein [Burkholderiales bacterium]